MIRDCKICGISDLSTLNYLINHPYPPKFIGFNCNFKKSPRFVEIDKLKKLTSIKKKDSKFVAVLVEPDDNILETDEFKETQMADNYIPQDFEIVDWSQEEMFDHILKRLEELEFKIDKLL